MIAAMIRRIAVPLILLPALIVSQGDVSSVAASGTMQKTFSSPEEAVKSLIAALRKNDTQELTAILGSGSREIVSSGDPVADKAGRERFLGMYEERNAIEGADTGKAVLSIGTDEYPFPIPVVKKGAAAWRFDARAGREEILNRRIGRNELNAIEVLHAYVDAQREYASQDHGSGAMEFAQKIRSTPGKKDGLYWEPQEGGEESPFGPLAAQAAKEGYLRSSSGKPAPFHGYLFRILKGQGKSADGGAYDYVVNGRMILGFAMVAYPAQYGSSGIMTFMVNQNGTVYQKDLGPDTAKIAASMKRYNPDRSWRKVD